MRKTIERISNLRKSTHSPEIDAIVWKWRPHDEMVVTRNSSGEVSKLEPTAQTVLNDCTREVLTAWRVRDES